LGVLVLVLGESRRSLFPDATMHKSLVACAAGVRREVRKTGVYLIHVAIVLGLLGYALSTYAQGRETDAMLRPDEPSLVHGYEITLVGSRGIGWDRDQGSLQEVHGLIEIRRDGQLVERTSLVMWLELYHHYAERVSVGRYTTEDLYLRPVAFITPERQFVAHEENVVLTSGQVDAIAITAKTLPGMHLVWGSLWMIVAAMIVNLFALGSPWEFSRPKASSSAD
jgi:cytochrome c biogenesis factor